MITKFNFNESAGYIPIGSIPFTYDFEDGDITQLREFFIESLSKRIVEFVKDNRYVPHTIKAILTYRVQKMLSEKFSHLNIHPNVHYDFSSHSPLSSRNLTKVFKRSVYDRNLNYYKVNEALIVSSEYDKGIINPTVYLANVHPVENYLMDIIYLKTPVLVINENYKGIFNDSFLRDVASSRSIITLPDEDMYKFLYKPLEITGFGQQNEIGKQLVQKFDLSNNTRNELDILHIKKLGMSISQSLLTVNVHTQYKGGDFAVNFELDTELGINKSNNILITTSVEENYPFTVSKVLPEPVSFASAMSGMSRGSSESGRRKRGSTSEMDREFSRALEDSRPVSSYEMPDIVEDVVEESRDPVRAGRYQAFLDAVSS